MGAWAWPKGKYVRQVTVVGATLLLVGAAAFMARRNTVLGRGDRRGAFRVALVLLALGVAAWALGAHHVADTTAEMELLWRSAGHVLLQSVLVWLFYLAVEPYARRLRPWTLVSWTRLLGGGVKDPVVGRDTLVGLAWGVALVLVAALARLAPAWLGQPGPEPVAGFTEALQAPRFALSAVAQMATSAILVSMGVLLLFVLTRLVLRRDALAVAALSGVALVSGLLGPPDARLVAAAVGTVFAVSWIALLLRFGLLAAIVGLFATRVLESLPLTTDLSSWTAGPTITAVSIVALLAALSFRAAAGPTGLRRALSAEPASRP
jgi:hypothetical protein